jgi:hypothetical protein
MKIFRSSNSSFSLLSANSSCSQFEPSDEEKFNDKIFCFVFVAEFRHYSAIFIIHWIRRTLPVAVDAKQKLISKYNINVCID